MYWLRRIHELAAVFVNGTHRHLAPIQHRQGYETRVEIDEYVDQQARVISECVRLLKANGSICWEVGNYVEDGEILPLDIILYPIFAKLGLKLRNRIV